MFEMEAADGNVAAVQAKLAEILVDTRAYDGCEGVTTWQDQDESARFVLLEMWASRAHSDAYSKWRSGRVEQDGLRVLLASAVKRHYDEVDA